MYIYYYYEDEGKYQQDGLNIINKYLFLHVIFENKNFKNDKNEEGKI